MLKHVNLKCQACQQTAENNHRVTGLLMICHASTQLDVVYKTFFFVKVFKASLALPCCHSVQLLQSPHHPRLAGSYLVPRKVPLHPGWSSCSRQPPSCRLACSIPAQLLTQKLGLWRLDNRCSKRHCVLRKVCCAFVQQLHTTPLSGHEFHSIRRIEVSLSVIQVHNSRSNPRGKN